MNPVNWDTSTNTGFTISGTQLTGQNASADWLSEIKSSDNYQIVQWTTTTHNAPFVIAGLAKDPYSSPSATHTSVEFGIMKKATSYAVYENGTNKYETSSPSMDDNIIMKVQQLPDGDIKYYVDGNLIYTSLQSTQLDLYAHATAYDAGVIPLMSGAAGGTLQESGALPIEHILFLQTVVPR